MPNRLHPVIYALLAIILAACSAAPSATPSPTRPQPSATATRRPTPVPTLTPDVPRGTLTIWHSWDEAYMPALVQIINDFRAENPDVLFDVLYVPEQDLLARAQVELSEGGGPMLLLGPAEWGPVLYQAGQIQDLTSLADERLLAAVNPAALAAARQPGALVGLPYRLQGIVLYRNKNIVTIDPTSIEEMVTLAQTSTSGKDIGAVLERSFFYSGAHLEGLGGRLMDENGLPAFNDEKGLAWIETLRSLEQAGPPNFQNDDDLEAFKQDRVGWIIDGTWNQQALAEAIGIERLAVDPWPSVPGGRLAGYVLSDNLYLTTRAGGDRQTTVRAFLEHFLSPGAQTHLAEAGLIPAVSGISLPDPLQGPLLAQTMAALAGGVPYPLSPDMPLYSETLDAALRAIFQDGIDPGQALADAEQSLLAEVSKVKATPTP